MDMWRILKHIMRIKDFWKYGEVSLKYSFIIWKEEKFSVV